MRVLIDDIQGGYDADTLHAEIDRAESIKAYAIWWPENPGDPLRVEIEREVLGAEAIVRAAAARAALASGPARSARSAQELNSRLIDVEMRRAAAERLGLTAEAARLAAEITTLRGAP